jgi:hypothetical protein
MDGIRGYIANFPLADLERILFADEQHPAAGKKDKQFFMMFGAVLPAALAWLDVHSARAHSTGLWLALKNSLIFGLIVQFNDEHFF